MKDHSPINEIMLAKYFAGETSPEEELLIQQWREEKAEHQRQYDAFDRIWQGAESEPEAFPVDVSAAWDKFRSQEADFAPSKRISLKTPTSRIFWQIAASILLIIGLGWVIWDRQHTNSNTSLLSMQSGNVEKVLFLPDSSRVVLSPNSFLRYPAQFDEPSREIFLRGEARFEVKKKGNTFRVKTESFEVEVLGTTFVVQAYENSSKQEVRVQEGRVRVRQEKAQIILQKNEKVQLNQSAKPLVKESFSEASAGEGKSLVFDFTDQPLEEVIRRLNEVYDLPILLQVQKPENCRLSVRFENESIQEIARIIAETLSLELLVEEGQLILKGESC